MKNVAKWARSIPVFRASIQQDCKPSEAGAQSGDSTGPMTSNGRMDAYPRLGVLS
jgi:hypothetical protein